MGNPFLDALAAISANKKTIWNQDAKKLRDLAKQDELTTEFKSASYITTIRSRSAKFTKIAFDPDEKQKETLAKVA